MSRSIDGVANWMNLFRWIVKLIRDEYGIDETRLTRTAVLETDCGLNIEQVEEVVAEISSSFGVFFPEGVLNEIVRLEELCMLAAWLHGLYKRPPFLSDTFAVQCMSLNTRAAAA